MMTTALGAMAAIPSFMGKSKDMKSDIAKAGKKSTKMINNKVNGRNNAALLATGVGGYLLAHAAPIRTLIRDK